MIIAFLTWSEKSNNKYKKHKNIFHTKACYNYSNKGSVGHLAYLSCIVRGLGYRLLQ